MMTTLKPAQLKKLLPIPSTIKTLKTTDGEATFLRLLKSRSKSDMSELFEGVLEFFDMAVEFEDLEAGSYRKAFAYNNTVIKVPLNTTGINCNLYEAGVYATDSFCGPVAASRLVWHESGLPLVLMERVKMRHELPNKLRDTEPSDDWVHEADGGQIGYSKREGRWVAYDAGCPPAWGSAPQPVWVAEALAMTVA